MAGAARLSMQHKKGPGGEEGEEVWEGTGFIDIGKETQKRFRENSDVKEADLAKDSVASDLLPLAGLLAGAGGAVAATALVPGLPLTLPLVQPPSPPSPKRPLPMPCGCVLLSIVACLGCQGEEPPRR